jgi:hypothetical protein
VAQLALRRARCSFCGVRQHVIAMLGGPGTARFVVQPLAAIALGVLHGISDRHGRSPLGSAGARRGGPLARLGEALWTIAVPLVLALGLSVVFQFVVRAQVRPSYAVLYALVFVVVPYFAARALTHGSTQRRRRAAKGSGRS